MGDQCMFVPEGDSFQPTEWAVGPWSKELLQGSAFGGLIVRALEKSAAPGMALARLSFDLWRPVTRERLTPAVSVLREGRKACTVEASLTQDGKAVARCTAVYLKADASLTPAPVDRTPPRLGPDAGRPIPDVGAQARWRAIDGRRRERGVRLQIDGGAPRDGLAVLGQRGFHRACLTTLAQHADGRRQPLARDGAPQVERQARQRHAGRRALLERAHDESAERAALQQLLRPRAHRPLRRLERVALGNEHALVAHGGTV